MAQMNVSIPDALKSWAEHRVAEGRYSSTSDYVRDLIRRDQERADAVAELQAAVDAGRSSGRSDKTISDVIVEAINKYP
ncbi:type II toxin-antitoxin system ParD family antitoxin [Sphingosinicella sp.]|uniref:type II toxin-antitoxin system ParD family antitoxin n=1 Tax=Sphingosinicella sp. TaxID=1917971 RepID=UPI0035AF7302